MIGLSVILGHRQAARLDSARLGSALLPKVLPKVGVWCGRDNMFSNKLAFGVDETTLDFLNVIPFAVSQRMHVMYEYICDCPIKSGFHGGGAKNIPRTWKGAPS